MIRCCVLTAIDTLSLDVICRARYDGDNNGLHTRRALVNSIVQRIAADGSVVTLSVPAEAGAMRWFGATRVVGPAINRSFGLAQAGQHKVIPKKIFPGGRVQAFRRVGFDLVLYEASDRSDSCLVWAGPYNEVTTWFGGPAPA